MSKRAKEEAYKRNKEIEEMIDANGSSPDNYTADMLKFISTYNGYGGLDEAGVTQTGALYEYFTPPSIIKAMWRLVLKHGFSGGNVLEPSAGTGRFITLSPKNNDSYPMSFTAIEPNYYSATICKLLNPGTIVEQKKFEEIFIDPEFNRSFGANVKERFDLVIGNPPYGSTTAGKGGREFNMGTPSEKSHTSANNYIEYFIHRGIEVLKPGGLLCFIIGSSQKLWLETGDSKAKNKIAKMARLIDAYKLPGDVFEFTSVASAIVVFRKKGIDERE